MNAAADRIERDSSRSKQLMLFSELNTAPTRGAHQYGQLTILEETTEFQENEVTALNRSHVEMPSQASNHANVLQTLIDSTLDQGPEFLRTANPLPVLDPCDRQEERLLDTILVAAPQ